MKSFIILFAQQSANTYFLVIRIIDEVFIHHLFFLRGVD